MDFGIALPTCVEGMAYPIRFADHEGILRIAQAVERLGYDSALVNDHYSTMPYVRDSFTEPPRFYEPMVTLTYVAAHTSRIKLMTGVVVMPMREPVLLAKQAACLDQISGGRLILGLGVGAYRAEFASVRPQIAKAPRGELVAEGIEALVELFGQRRASYTGAHLEFHDVEMFPKPAADPFPILSCGNAPATIRRAATLCAGWMPAGLPDDRIAAGVAEMRRQAVEAGRDADALMVAAQTVLCIDDDIDAAAQRFRGSQVYEHLASLRQSTLRDVDIDAYMSQNLIGGPGQIIDRIHRLAEVGVNHLAGLIVVANTEAELLDQIERFAADVLPAFGKNIGDKK
ncbi:MAG: TIGR03619 family F420-dependent LLM class oxidoreductase [Actinomycetia bacterium]|nr:TIGR03619 family F420-dependent LLM class oxidoreductase [Actinomycetes bacterium]